jgi:hypothetical protein
MATQTARPLFVVSGAGTENEIDKIKYTVEAPMILNDAIQNFENQRTKAKDEFDKSLASDIATGGLHVGKVIESYEAWEATDDALKTKSETAKKLKPIIEKLIEELKASHQAALAAVIAQLKNEAAAENQRAELTKQQIAYLEALLGKPSSAIAKRKKR